MLAATTGIIGGKMAENIAVSIVVPVYNTGVPLLHRGLESLLVQTLADTEIVLVDDGSTDEATVAACREYAEKNPKIRLVTGPNGGLSVARNRGIDAARGEWIYFCDSDDTAEPDACAFLLDLMARNHTDFACCSMQCDDSRSEDIRCDVRIDAPEEVWDRNRIHRDWIAPLFRLNPGDDGKARGYVVLSLFRRSLLNGHSIRFVPGIHMEDEIFMLEYLWHVEQVAVSGRVCYHYRANENSICSALFRKKTTPFFKLEKDWKARWELRLQLCRKFGWDQEFPGVGLRFWYNAAYHAAQTVCADRSLSPAAKFRRLRETLTEYRNAPEYRGAVFRDHSGGRMKQLFRLCAEFGPLPVWGFCTIARLLKSRG